MKILCKNKNWKIDKDYDINKILYLLIDRPICIDSFYHDFIWLNKNKEYHREYDLPAFIYSNGYYIEWIKNDLSQKVKKSVNEIFD